MDFFHFEKFEGCSKKFPRQLFWILCVMVLKMISDLFEDELRSYASIIFILIFIRDLRVFSIGAKTIKKPTGSF